MSGFKSKPKGGSIYEAYWQELYVITEHWKSDLLFYKDDVIFLHQLIDKYFIWITKKQNTDQVREIYIELNELNKKCDELLEKMERHLTNLATLIGTPFKYDSFVIRKVHEQLEEELAEFVKTFRNNRKEVFAITDRVIESEEFV